MKTYVTYGFFLALAGLLCNLVLYFLGYHSDAAKMESSKWAASIVSLVIAVAIIILGTKARRESIPPSEGFSYGRALGAGVMIVLFGSLFGIVTNILYFKFINPGMMDVIMQANLDKMEAQGMSGAKLEQAEKGMRMMMPIMIPAFGFLASMFFGTVVSLITAAVLKRPAVETIPDLPASS
jgi:hypothetical protein